jgi:hypothetical protein
MNKILYILLIVFWVIITASGIWNFIMMFQIGAEIYKLNSYIAWFLSGNIIATAGSILLLKYYLHNNYRFSFFTGAILVIANLGYFAVCYVNLTSGELRGYYMPTLVLYLGALILYSVSLIFSDIRKRYWLKLAGIFGLMLTLILASAFIGGFYAKDVWTIGMLQKIIRWTSVAACPINVMFIINFLDEIRLLKTENANVPGKKYPETIWGFLTIGAVVSTIIIGTLLAHERGLQPAQQNYNAEQAQVLVKLAGAPKNFINSEGDSLHYLLIKPQNYDKQKKYPLVVCLPWGGYECPPAEALAGMDGSTNPAFIFLPN